MPIKVHIFIFLLSPERFLLTVLVSNKLLCTEEKPVPSLRVLKVWGRTEGEKENVRIRIISVAWLIGWPIRCIPWANQCMFPSPRDLLNQAQTECTFMFIAFLLKIKKGNGKKKRQCKRSPFSLRLAFYLEEMGHIMTTVQTRMVRTLYWYSQHTWVRPSTGTPRRWQKWKLRWEGLHFGVTQSP